MHERLVELWLDSASERSFQAPFCQALAHQGYTILHNTRHAPLEFGKDVIAQDPDGNLVAYQLKGHPGSRMTLRALREVYDQLFELVSTPIVHPGIEASTHASYLVTNGEVDEEARELLNKFNEKQVSAGYPDRKVFLLSRGELLKLFSDMGHMLWPSEIQNIAVLAELMALDGNGHMPAVRLSRLLQELLGLTETDDPGEHNDDLGVAEAERRISSAAVLVGVALHRFDAASNHVAMVDGWTMFLTYTIATLERNEIAPTKRIKQALSTARATVRHYLTLLARELIDRPTSIDGDGSLANGVLFQARATLVAGVLSVLHLWCERDGWEPEVGRGELTSALGSLESHLFLWGEGAIPQLLAYYWHGKSVNAGWTSDGVLHGLVEGTTPRWAGDDWTGLAPPYFTYEDVAKHHMRAFFRSGQDPLEKEALGTGSYFLYSLFLLLVRTNRKNGCRLLWPAVSRPMQREFVPADPWRFCLHRSRHGVYKNDASPRTLKWADAIKEAQATGCPEMPTLLSDDPVLLLLHCIFRPWRATRATVLHLGRSFATTWY